MIILGLDTALRSTGYGVVKMEGGRHLALDCGVIQNPRSLPLSECLCRLSRGVEELLDSFSPDVAAIEGGFFSRNAKTAMILGMARGAVVSVLSRRSIPVYEYAPRRAKQAIVGYGNASKEQVARVLGTVLALDISTIPDDSTDGFAMALCHAMTQNSHQGVYLPDPL